MVKILNIFSKNTDFKEVIMGWNTCDPTTKLSWGKAEFATYDNPDQYIDNNYDDKKADKNPDEETDKTSDKNINILILNFSAGLVTALFCCLTLCFSFHN